MSFMEIGKDFDRDPDQDNGLILFLCPKLFIRRTKLYEDPNIKMENDKDPKESGSTWIRRAKRFFVRIVVN